MSRTWTKWRYRNAGWGRVPVSRFMVGATYPCTWRKVRERNTGGARGGAWRELRERETALALQAAQYQQGILPAWAQAIALATTVPSVKWHDPVIIGHMDEGLHYADLMKRAERTYEWRP